VKSVPRGEAVWNANGGFVSVLLTHLLPAIDALVTRHSLVERMARYLFYCMFVCSSTSTKCGRTLVPDVSFPLLGVGGPRRAEKGANEIFVTIGVNGEFLHFGGFRAISQQRLHASTPNIICIRIMSADVPPPPVGSIGPWGAGGGGVKTKK